MEVVSGLRDRFLHWARPLHRKLRRQKVELFLRIVRDSSMEDTLLDVGGGPGIDGEFLGLYSSFSRVVAVNLDTQQFQVPTGIHVKKVKADGCDLPFESESFDWVFSNAVIEHVGNFKKQKQFADEIRRVAAKGYFVTTPNKFFPLEPHTFLPFYQFLPTRIQRRLAPYSPGYLKQYEEINLLSAKQMQELFPEARVMSVGLPVFGNSLVAWHLKSQNHNINAKGSAIGFPSACPSLRSSPENKIHVATKTCNKKRLEDAPHFGVLGVRINAVQVPDVVALMEQWIYDRGPCRSIAATSMNGIVEAQHDPSFKEILNATDLVVPDGMPLIWLGRRQGHRLSRRVYGPDLMLAFCEKTSGQGYRHFFYGGEREPDVPERLAEILKIRFPGTQVVGTYSRRLSSLTSEEDDEILAMISCAAPDVLWVGLGEPRQVRWMHEHKDRLRVPVIVGVGAAFDMLSGRRKQAPRWMREHGLEWSFRLLQEPRRLWRRYLVYGTQFIAYLALESLRLKNFQASGAQPPNRMSGKQVRT